jgi:hypothetical protein
VKLNAVYLVDILFSYGPLVKMFQSDVPLIVL